ncbi:MAG: hypothetical protein Fur0018_18180 [Anaerolineales bacterium]
MKALLSDAAPGNGARSGLADFVNLFLGTDWLQAQTRNMVRWTGYGIAWLAFALSMHRPGIYADFIASSLAWWNVFFAPDTLLFLLVLRAAEHLAYIWAAGYIADIFELPDDQVARQYVKLAAFGSGQRRDVVEIDDHNVRSRYVDHPLIKIGGPGQVLVHVESVALFEKIDGTPRILGPSNAKQRISGFERLRAVIDLRDHTESFDVEARTRDGILLRAKNVRVIFSVVRGSDWHPENWHGEQNLPHNWSYDPQAVRDLVYKQRKRPWHRAMVDGKASPQLRNFISRHTFQELVSNILPAGDAATMQFVFRKELYQVFEDEFRKALQGSGIQLKWIGVGTWELDSGDLEEKHLALWQRTLAARKQVGETALTKLYNNTRLDTLLCLVQRTLTAVTVSNHADVRDDLRVRAVLQELRQRLRQAVVWYQHQGQTPPVALREVDIYLGRLLSNRLNGPLA